MKFMTYNLMKMHKIIKILRNLYNNQKVWIDYNWKINIYLQESNKMKNTLTIIKMKTKFLK